MPRRVSLVLSAFIACLIASNLCAAVQYNAVEIGLPGTVCFASQINANGDVLGNSGASPFVYSDGAFRLVTDLGTDPHFRASHMNDLGQFAGDLIHGQENHAALFAGGVTSSVDTTDVFSSAGPINDAGQIAGIAGTSLSSYKLVVFDHGQVQVAGALRTNGLIAPMAINSSGAVVGYGQAISVVNHAFIYSGGVLKDLTPGVSAGTFAYGINDSGDIVGVYDTESFYYSGGKMTLVNAAELLGINNSGKAVGDIGSGASQRAVLYENGNVEDLNTLVSLPGGWTLTSAHSINDQGQIVAWGTNATGLTHSFILTPVPEPGCLLLVPAFALFLCRRRMSRGPCGAFRSRFGLAEDVRWTYEQEQPSRQPGGAAGKDV